MNVSAFHGLLQIAGESALDPDSSAVLGLNARFVYISASSTFHKQQGL